jgi:hypothetical protein
MSNIPNPQQFEEADTALNTKDYSESQDHLLKQDAKVLKNIQEDLSKKAKQIQLLQLISRAIQKFQEKKDQKNEERMLNDLKSNLKTL